MAPAPQSTPTHCHEPLLMGWKGVLCEWYRDVRGLASREMADHHHGQQQLRGGKGDDYSREGGKGEDNEREGDNNNEGETTTTMVR
jgi:hypothetical protein